MIEDFNVSEKGHGSYWLLGILRWVMVLIFISFGIQKFTPQSADGIAVYISNSPFVSWLSIFGIRGEADLLGTIELTTAIVLAAGAFIRFYQHSAHQWELVRLQLHGRFSFRHRVSSNGAYPRTQ
jgi:uncharacterized membrane protein YphA (DoxX/SURF4 family)